MQKLRTKRLKSKAFSKLLIFYESVSFTIFLEGVRSLNTEPLGSFSWLRMK